MNKNEDAGILPFWCMMIIIAFLLVVCVVLPIAIPGFSQQPYALPLMGTGLALPFIHFFIFGGKALAEKKRRDRRQ